MVSVPRFGWSVMVRFSQLVLCVSLMNSIIAAQNPYDRGTPAEAKAGLAGLTAYAPDKVETVNLANGALNVNIPLASAGGRGSASFTIALSYHNKMWASRYNRESISSPTGEPPVVRHHFIADYGDGVYTLPNEMAMGGGWFISKGPAINFTGPFFI